MSQPRSRTWSRGRIASSWGIWPVPGAALPRHEVRAEGARPEARSSPCRPAAGRSWRGRTPSHPSAYRSITPPLRPRPPWPPGFRAALDVQGDKETDGPGLGRRRGYVRHRAPVAFRRGRAQRGLPLRLLRQRGLHEYRRSSAPPRRPRAPGPRPPRSAIPSRTRRRTSCRSWPRTGPVRRHGVRVPPARPHGEGPQGQEHSRDQVPSHSFPPARRAGRARTTIPSSWPGWPFARVCSRSSRSKTDCGGASRRSIPASRSSPTSGSRDASDISASRTSPACRLMSTPGGSCSPAACSTASESPDRSSRRPPWTMTSSGSTGGRRSPNRQEPRALRRRSGSGGAPASARRRRPMVSPAPNWAGRATSAAAPAPIWPRGSEPDPERGGPCCYALSGAPPDRRRSSQSRRVRLRCTPMTGDDRSAGATAGTSPASIAGVGSGAAPPGRSSHAGSIAVAMGILLSRLAGLLRQSVFAFFFGNTDAADVFNAGFRIPNLLQNLFGEGALSASFIPVYARLRRGRGRRGGDAGGLGGRHPARAWRSRSWSSSACSCTRSSSASSRRDSPARSARLAIRLVRIFFPGAGLLVMSAWCARGPEQPPEVLPVVRRSGRVERRHTWPDAGLQPGDRRVSIWRSGPPGAR